MVMDHNIATVAITPALLTTIQAWILDDINL
jgi:hypothetical protein